jgi:hypothetical protein
MPKIRISIPANDSSGSEKAVLITNINDITKNRAGAKGYHLSLKGGF